MYQNSNMSDLLDLLVERSGCDYISDLHQPQYATEVRNAVLAVDVQAYTVQAWNDVVRYITLEERTFPTAQTAVEHLLTFLEA